jgi:hypothetical protein
MNEEPNIHSEEQQSVGAEEQESSLQSGTEAQGFSDPGDIIINNG